MNIDVSDGPLVLETPPMSLGVIDDMWFNWVTDFGLPGPDRGEGGKYLLVPPGYAGELPEAGYFVQELRTTRALMLGWIPTATTSMAPRPTRSLCPRMFRRRSSGQ